MACDSLLEVFNDGWYDGGGLELAGTAAWLREMLKMGTSAS